MAEVVVVNALGAVATGLVLVVVVATKFTQGAWLVTVAIPLLVLMFLGIHRHYRRTARRLRASAAAITASKTPQSVTVLAVDAIDAAAERAVWYARAVGGDGFRPVHVPGRGTDTAIHPRWLRWIGRSGPRLEILSAATGASTPCSSTSGRSRGRRPTSSTSSCQSTSRGASLLQAASTPAPFLLKLRLLKEPGIVITDVPVVGDEQPIGKRLVGRVLVSGVHGASLRALAYAAHAPARRHPAVFFAFDGEEAAEMRSDWRRAQIDVELEIVEAPYRDLGEPLTRYLHELTSDDTVAVVVMPELVVPWLATAPAQPACALRQAPAAVRAPRHPLERSLPAEVAVAALCGVGHRPAGQSSCLLLRARGPTRRERSSKWTRNRLRLFYVDNNCYH